MHLSKIFKYGFFLYILLGFQTGCKEIIGEEIARIPVNFLSTKDSVVVQDITIYLHENDRISFWTDMDIEYKGEVFLLFQIRIFKDNIEMGALEIDPMNKEMTINELKRTVLNKTKWKFTGKNATIGIPEDGLYTFKANLLSNHNNSLKVYKAEIILKK